MALSTGHTKLTIFLISLYLLECVVVVFLADVYIFTNISLFGGNILWLLLSVKYLPFQFCPGEVGKEMMSVSLIKKSIKLVNMLKST